MKDSSHQVSRRSVLRAAGAAAGAGLSAGIAAGRGGCGQTSATKTFTGQVSNGNAEHRRYVPQSTDPCEIRLELSADDFFGAGIQMFVTTDGRKPTRKDHDASEMSFWGSDSLVFDDVSGQTVIRVRVESVYGATGFELTVEERTSGSGGGGTECSRSMLWSKEGTIERGGDATFIYETQTKSPCSATVELQGPQDMDLDLYVTTDGRIPSQYDFDRRSFGEGSTERIELGSDEVSPGGRIGILVKSYAGSGDFSLELTETGDGLRQDGGGGGCEMLNEREITLDLTSENEIRTVYSPLSSEPCSLEFVAATTSETTSPIPPTIELRRGGRLPTRFQNDRRTRTDGTTPATASLDQVAPDESVGLQAYAPEDSDGELTVRVREYGMGQTTQPDPVSDPGVCGSLINRRQVTVDVDKVSEFATAYSPEAARDPDAPLPCKVVVSIQADDTGRVAGVGVRSDGQIPETQSEAERYATGTATTTGQVVYGVVDPDTVYGISPSIDDVDDTQSDATMTLTIEEWR